MRPLTLVVAAALLSACAPPAPAEKAAAPASDSPTQPTGPIVSEGVITDLDRPGKISLDHNAIPEIGWSAMTMQFNADPGLLAGLAEGDRVTFELESAENPRTIIRLEKN